MNCNHATDYGFLHIGDLSILDLSDEVSAYPAAFWEDGSFRLLNSEPPDNRDVPVYRLLGETIDGGKDGEIHLRVSVAAAWPCKWA